MSSDEARSTLYKLRSVCLNCNASHRSGIRSSNTLNFVGSCLRLGRLLFVSPSWWQQRQPSIPFKQSSYHYRLTRYWTLWLPLIHRSRVYSNARSANGDPVPDFSDKAAAMIIASDPIRRTASNPDIIGSHTGVKSIPSRLLSERLSSSTSSLMKGAKDQTYQTQISKRMYASNSVKVKDIQVTSSCFEKIKLLGKGDIGRVFLVQRKGGEKLYAMKGKTTGINSNSRHRYDSANEKFSFL